ncbi:MAG: hypothetical protein H7Y88_12555 [Phycisphaerales bacterium]|nr:hypothetical protein [Phycisphaerales bacterium]
MSRRVSDLRSRSGRAQRGTVYLLVLGVSAIITITGLSALAAARVKSRMASRARDWAESGVLAVTAAEFAAHSLATDGSWRKVRGSGTAYPVGAIGRGAASFIVDDADGSLTDDYFDTVRVLGVGTVGEATRSYSFEAVPASKTALEVFRCAVHSAASLISNGTVTVDGGPLSSNGTITVGLLGTLRGNVEAAAFTNLGTHKGTAEVPWPAKQMPTAGVFTLYSDMATVIPWGVITGGAIQNVLFATPDGSGNGVFSITVPSGSRLLIRDCRLRATLVVSLGAGSDLVLEDEVLWEPPRPDFPILIVKGTGANDIDLNCSGAVLSEVVENLNFNPAGVPYAGGIDADKLDNYPNELRGVIHILGVGASTVVRGSTRVVGALISDGPVTVDTRATLSSDETLLKFPLLGYTDASPGTMQPVAGTWTWDEAP